jgi:CheY-like chemotaxis protein
MQSLAEVIKALATLAWPVLASVVFYKFFPSIKAFLSRDKVTLKIGEMEITAEQAAQSLVSQVEDLQNKIAAIEKKLLLEYPQSPIEDHQLTYPIRRGDKFRILWVDDFPSNNAIQIKKFMGDGLWVDVASSTDQAVQMLEFTKYDLVISDMGRVERGQHHPKAGILLAQEIRKRNATIPIIVFSAKSAIERYNDEAVNAGVSYLTNSTVDLYSIVAIELNKVRGAT